MIHRSIGNTQKFKLRMKFFRKFIVGFSAIGLFILFRCTGSNGCGFGAREKSPQGKAASVSGYVFTDSV
jgi:hypothetical protein